MSCQIFNVAMHITEVNKRSGVCKFSFHQKVFYAFWIVESCFFYYSLYFLKVAEPSARLNIFEIDIRIISLG